MIRFILQNPSNWNKSQLWSVISWVPDFFSLLPSSPVQFSSHLVSQNMTQSRSCVPTMASSITCQPQPSKLVKSTITIRLHDRSSSKYSSWQMASMAKGILASALFAILLNAVGTSAARGVVIEPNPNKEVGIMINESKYFNCKSDKTQGLFGNIFLFYIFKNCTNLDSLV